MLRSETPRAVSCRGHGGAHRVEFWGRSFGVEAVVSLRAPSARGSVSAGLCPQDGVGLPVAVARPRTRQEFRGMSVVDGALPRPLVCHGRSPSVATRRVARRGRPLRSSGLRLQPPQPRRHPLRRSPPPPPARRPVSTDGDRPWRTRGRPRLAMGGSLSGATRPLTFDLRIGTPHPSGPPVRYARLRRRGGMNRLLSGAVGWAVRSQTPGGRIRATKGRTGSLAPARCRV